MLDPDDRILLLRIEQVPGQGIHRPDRIAPPSFWITVGGGLDAGETFEQAAHREVFEETGITGLALGPRLWVRDRIAHWNGEEVRCIEHFHVGRVTTTDVVFDHLDADEQVVVREHRWWTLDEIAAHDRADVIYPEELGDLLRQGIGAGPSM